MSKPSSFIANTDFATLKNSQAELPGTVTVPSSTVVAAGSYSEWHVDVPITEPYAIMASRISSSKNSNRWLFGNTSVMDRIGNAGGAAPYSLYAFVWRVSSNVIRLQVTMNNPYGVSLTGAAGAETFNFSVNSFVPPFA